MDTSELLIAVLSVAFGLWAGVVAYIGSGIRSDLKQISVDMKAESFRLNQYIVQTEKRLAVIEDRILSD